MKKFISYILSWSLFWFGHLVSLIMGTIPALYTTYRWAMFKSMQIQDWAENETPWKHIKENECQKS
jgi:hypothetical protein